MPGFEFAQRRLRDYTFEESKTTQIDLDDDVVARAAFMTLHGSVVTTFGSGSPAAPFEAAFSTLVTNATVRVNGRTVKSVMPWMLHLTEQLAFGNIGERRSSAGASAATGDLPTVDAGFTFGSTTNRTTVRETVMIPFEMVLAKANATGTWLDLRGAMSPVIQLSTAAFAALDTTGAPVAYTGSTLVIETFVEEVLGVPRNPQFADFRQIWKTERITSQATDYQIDLNVGNLYAGVLLYVTEPLPTDLGLTDIRIMAGNKILKQTTFALEQARNRMQYGITAPRSSNKSTFDGACYLNLLTNDRDLSTAFDARNLNALRLVISTHASVDYPVVINIEEHEVARVG